MAYPQIIFTTAAKLDSVAFQDGQIIFVKDAKLLYADMDETRVSINIGIKGDTGPQGIQGPKGDKGEQGTQGINLILKSDIENTNNEYRTGTYKISEPIEKDQIYTVTVWGNLGDEKTEFGAYIMDGYHDFITLKKISDGIYKGTGNYPYYDDDISKDNTTLIIYAIPQSVTTSSTITKIKLEKGSIDNPVWTASPEDLKTTAENFEGILPIEKGGTGNTDGNAAPYGLRKVETKDQWGNREGTTLVEYDTPGHPLNTGGGLYLSEIPQSGYKLNITIDGWYYCNEGNDRVATLNEVSTTQLALTSLYEARAVTTASADMTMESPSIDGELSELDKNMTKVYVDLCLNKDSGKTIDNVPEHLKPYVQAIIDETIAKQKEIEEYQLENQKEE